MESGKGALIDPGELGVSALGNALGAAGTMLKLRAEASPANASTARSAAAAIAALIAPSTRGEGRRRCRSRAPALPRSLPPPRPPARPGRRLLSRRHAGA